MAAAGSFAVNAMNSETVRRALFTEWPFMNDAFTLHTNLQQRSFGTFRDVQ